MKKILILIFALGSQILNANEIIRDSIFNFNWKFHKGDVADAYKKDFDDKAWRILDLPHDWSIEDLNISDTSENRIISGPFDSQTPEGYRNGFTHGGTAWYRKQFFIPDNWKGKVVYLFFEGVYMNTDVWINEQHLENHPYGYTSFRYELSKHLKYGSDNVVALQVKNEGINSRWYSGSGIYRHVRISVLNPFHIDQCRTFINTQQADSSKAMIKIQLVINNFTYENKNGELDLLILNSENEVVSQKTIQIKADSKNSISINDELELEKPQLWSPENAYLYTFVCELYSNEKLLDHTSTKFGIRSIQFSAQKGFLLNGKKTLLKGGCIHANNGPLGAAAFDWAEERKVILLKNAGFNAIRCAHNPPSIAFLDACDKYGMLVINEAFDTWNIPKVKDDYSIYFSQYWQKDIESMVLRDRNHPCIILWSIGNQIRGVDKPEIVNISKQIKEFLLEFDNTRPVTVNVIYRGQRENIDSFYSTLDVCGYSYAKAHYENDHERFPDRIMIASEINPRQSFENWTKAVDLDYVIGNFEWTAIDYFGEVAIGWHSYRYDPTTIFPWIVNYSSDFDICGFKRPRSYYRDALWDEDDKLSVFVHCPKPTYGKPITESPWGWDDVKASWTWLQYKDSIMTIEAYSSCDSVTLFLNGKKIGSGITSRETEYKALWKVPYKKGTLMAKGYSNGEIITSCFLKTANNPYKINLIADKNDINADGLDLVYIIFEIADKSGYRHPDADNLVEFEIEGPGKIVGVGNSDPLSIESFQKPYRKAHDGRGIVIIRSIKKEGKIILHARSQGLRSDKIEINCIKD